MKWRLVTAVFLALCSTARANDLPVKGNLAAEEEQTIERGFYAVDRSTKIGANLYSIIATKILWPTGTLRVCFWNGPSTLQKEVAGIADDLVLNLPVKFDWGPSGTIAQCSGADQADGPWKAYQVRVSLVNDQSLVASGDDASQFFALIGRQDTRNRRATVNLPFAFSTTVAMKRYRVLHEFCHVLGCMHEFSRSICTKDFDKDKIEATFHLSDAEYRQNFIYVADSSAFGGTPYGAFDPKSVMMYSLSADMFLPGANSPCAISSPPSTLSTLDAQGLRTAYGSIYTQAVTYQTLSMAEASYRGAAASLHAYSASLRSSANRADFAEGVNRGAGSLAIAGLATDAEIKANAMDAAAADFALTPAQRKDVEAALALLP